MKTGGLKNERGDFVGSGSLILGYIVTNEEAHRVRVRVYCYFLLLLLFVALVVRMRAYIHTYMYIFIYRYIILSSAISPSCFLFFFGRRTKEMRIESFFFFTEMFLCYEPEEK